MEGSSHPLADPLYSFSTLLVMCCWEEPKAFTGSLPVKAVFLHKILSFLSGKQLRSYLQGQLETDFQIIHKQPSLTWPFAALGFGVACSSCSVTILVLSLELMRERGRRVTGLKFTKSVCVCTGTLQCPFQPAVPVHKGSPGGENVLCTSQFAEEPH